jgi:BlaI family penicillinase repressor
MVRSSELSRRERQIMDVIYARKEASVLEIQKGLPDAPSATAIRTLLRILEDKGHVRRRKEGREFVYLPTQPRQNAGFQALQHLLATFFEGSIESALAAHLTGNKNGIPDSELRRLLRLIRDSRKKGD